MPSTNNLSSQQGAENNLAETPTTDLTIKCLGADRKYFYTTQEACDAHTKYWTKVLGSFPTDPGEIIHCKGADGKYSDVPRKTCEDTNNFWDAHKPSSPSNVSSNSIDTSSGNTSPTLTPSPTPTATPWYLAGGAPTPIAAYQADGVDDIATSQINLVNPGTYNLTIVPGQSIPSWDAVSGWSMNGGQVWDTGVAPGPTYSAIISFSNQSNTVFSFFGSDGRNAIPAVDFAIDAIHMPGIIDYILPLWGLSNGGPIPTTGSIPFISSGVMGLTPAQAWKNGVSVGSKTPDWTGTNPYSIFLGARSHHGASTSPSIGNIQRFAVWNVDISAYMPTLSTAILQ